MALQQVYHVTIYGLREAFKKKIKSVDFFLKMTFQPTKLDEIGQNS